MEVLVESPNRSPSPMDNFDLSSVMISPYLSAPSSPKRFGEYYSEFYQEFDYFSSSSSIPFEAPTNNNVGEDDDGGGGDGFAFYVNRESDTSSRSAEELFDGGKIKPLKPESEGKKNVLQAFSPKKKNKSRYGDPFASENEQKGRERGRDRTPASVLSSSNSGRRVTRSHSPNYRTPQHTWEEQQQQQPPRKNKEESTTSSSNSRVSSSSSSSSKGSCRRWRLRDILLFRSVSEGRGSSKDTYKKYTSSGYKKGEEVNATRRKGPVSAHELHYAMKKAESEDLKKRTFLPYKQGILGKLAGFGF